MSDADAMASEGGRRASLMEQASANKKRAEAARKADKGGVKRYLAGGGVSVGSVTKDQFEGTLKKKNLLKHDQFEGTRTNESIV